MPVNYVTTDKPFFTSRCQRWAPLSTGALWGPTFSGTTTSCQGSALTTLGAASTSSGRPSEPRQPPPAISRSLRWEMISTRSVQFPSITAWRKKVVGGRGVTQWWNHDSCKIYYMTDHRQSLGQMKNNKVMIMAVNSHKVQIKWILKYCAFMALSRLIVSGGQFFGVLTPKSCSFDEREHKHTLLGHGWLSVPRSSWKGGLEHGSCVLGQDTDEL